MKYFIIADYRDGLKALLSLDGYDSPAVVQSAINWQGKLDNGADYIPCYRAGPDTFIRIDTCATIRPSSSPFTAKAWEDFKAGYRPMTRSEHMTWGKDEWSKPRAAATHRAYWAQFVNDATRRAVVRSFPAELLASALASGDRHFNGDHPSGDWRQKDERFNLKNWDRMGRPPVASQPLKDAGEGWSPSVETCLWKEAARQVAEEFNP